MFDSRRLFGVALCCATASPMAPAQEPEAAPLEERVAAALDRARPHMEVQALTVTHAGRLGLLALAMLHDRWPADNAHLQRTIDKLAAAVPPSTYGLSLRLMVIAEHPGYPDRRAAARRDLAALLRHQTSAGGFGYTPGAIEWDLSNTQYAALGLRAAHATGAAVDAAVWKRLLGAMRWVQARSGGFGYAPTVRTPSASMTVAGIAVLEICRQHLADLPRGAKVEDRLAAAWRWMERNQELIGREGQKHLHYWHYGLERAAILAEVERVGEVDWYRAGAEMLLGLERKTGGWADVVRRASLRHDPGAEVVATSFAVLFLRRAFRRETGPVTLRGGYLTRGLPADASPAQIERAVELDVARGTQAIPELVKALRSPLRSRREAASQALRALGKPAHGYDPGLAPAAQGEAIVAAERWWLLEVRPRTLGGG